MEPAAGGLGLSSKTVICRRTGAEEEKKDKKRGSIINDNVAYVHSLIRSCVAAGACVSQTCFSLPTAGRPLAHGDPSSQTSLSHI